MGFKADMAVDAVKHRVGCIEKLSKAKDHRTRKEEVRCAEPGSRGAKS